MTAMAPRSLLMIALLLVWPAAAPAHAQTSQEEVKATFVYRFASYIEWPPTLFVDAQTPVRVCVIGADPFARTLERATIHQRRGERTFEVRRIGGAGELEGCHAVYVVGDRTEAVLRAAHRRAVLTITDSVSGTAERGVIHFALVDSRVRFYIDDAAAAENGLAIDARLLNLALAVRRRPAS